MSLWWNLIKTLYGQYGSNHIAVWSEFARNIANFNIDQTIYDFDKDWSKFTKWTIWINPYCPWLKFFKNITNSKKEKDNTVQSAFYLDLSLLYMVLINIDQCFLNGRCRSNHILCDTNFLKTFKTEKNAWAVNENMIGSLKRKITVKLSHPWYNFSINL